MIVADLLTELNEMNLVTQVIDILDSISHQVRCEKGEDDKFFIYVIAPDNSIEQAVVTVRINGVVRCDNFIHMQMEINALTLPPYESDSDDLAKILFNSITRTMTSITTDFIPNKKVANCLLISYN